MQAYVDSHGLIHQCMHCRRTQFQGETHRWDFVPEWVKKMPKCSSHDLCPACFQYYYLTMRGEFDAG